MKFHWREHRLADTVTDGKAVKRFVFDLFDEAGTLCGYVRNTAGGTWEARVGRQGKITGIFDSRAEAKNLVLTEAKLACAEER